MTLLLVAVWVFGVISLVFRVVWKPLVWKLSLKGKIDPRMNVNVRVVVRVPLRRWWGVLLVVVMLGNLFGRVVRTVVVVPRRLILLVRRRRVRLLRLRSPLRVVLFRLV